MSKIALLLAIIGVLLLSIGLLLWLTPLQLTNLTNLDFYMPENSSPEEVQPHDSLVSVLEKKSETGEFDLDTLQELRVNRDETIQLTATRLLAENTFENGSEEEILQTITELKQIVNDVDVSPEERVKTGEMLLNVHLLVDKSKIDYYNLIFSDAPFADVATGADSRNEAYKMATEWLMKLYPTADSALSLATSYAVELLEETDLNEDDRQVLLFKLLDSTDEARRLYLEDNPQALRGQMNASYFSYIVQRALHNSILVAEGISSPQILESLISTLETEVKVSSNIEINRFLPKALFYIAAYTDIAYGDDRADAVALYLDNSLSELDKKSNSFNYIRADKERFNNNPSSYYTQYYLNLSGYSETFRDRLIAEGYQLSTQ